jgi:hypothetical protein
MSSGEMFMTNRRQFMMQLGLTGAALIASQAMAQSSMVVETEPQPMALGYKADAAKVDRKKFPKFAEGQKCGGCALYQGKAGDASGGCALFPGKKVAANGWCSAWSKKA